jgi:aldehyde dehydrogenase (NAD+)
MCYDGKVDEVCMQDLLKAQQQLFSTGITREIDYRKQQLIKLRDGLIRYEDEILAALKADLNKSDIEAYATELGYCLSSIRFTLYTTGIKRDR